MCVQIGLWDVQAASPAVRNVPVFDDGAVMCPLEDAMPLRALIAPLDTFREQMAAAVDQLQPAPARGRLALGSIVNAVLDYLVRPPPLHAHVWDPVCVMRHAGSPRRSYPHRM